MARFGSDSMEYKELGRTGEKIPALGMGTWGMGGHFERDEHYDDREIGALKSGMEMGLTVIDTAEIYGAGHAEELVGEAIKGQREEVFLITKVWPSHYTYDDVLKAMRGSLSRLQTTYVDLYLLHWPSSSVPIGETMRAMEHLVDEGRTRYIGVSNFTELELKEAMNALFKYEIVANEIRYNILIRSAEKNPIPFCTREGITVISYRPIERGSILTGYARGVLEEVGKKYGKTPVQVALNWLISKPGTVAIPKASKIEHLREIVGSLNWKLSSDDLKFLERKIRW